MLVPDILDRILTKEQLMTVGKNAKAEPKANTLHTYQVALVLATKRNANSMVKTWITWHLKY